MRTSWKEYKSDNGIIYYHNHDTQESVWKMPSELAEVKEKISTIFRHNEASEKVMF